jgi:hypothetical protein
MKPPPVCARRFHGGRAPQQVAGPTNRRRIGHLLALLSAMDK